MNEIQKFRWETGLQALGMVAFCAPSVVSLSHGDEIEQLGITGIVLVQVLFSESRRVYPEVKNKLFDLLALFVFVAALAGIVLLGVWLAIRTPLMQEYWDHAKPLLKVALVAGWFWDVRRNWRKLSGIQS